jgi:hypothetical protein
VYAQVVTSALRPEVPNDLVCALRQEPGFSGALSMIDRATGDALVVVFWETEEQAARPIADVLALSALGPCSSTVWELDARG